MITNQNITNTYKFLFVKKEYPWHGKEMLEEYLKNNKDKFVIAVDEVIDP